MRYEPISMVEQGSTAAVILCTDLYDDTCVAVKIVSSKRKAFAEMAVLNLVGHPNIIDLLDFYEDDDRRIALVMPAMDMDLEKFTRTEHFTSPGTIMRQVASAVRHLHIRELLHLDIKLENVGVILDGSVVCKLLDFGSAMRQCDILSGTRICCTRAYMAPEMDHGVVTSAGDVYALGIMLLAMLQRLGGEHGELVALGKKMTERIFTARPTIGGVMEVREQFTQTIPNTTIISFNLISSMYGYEQSRAYGVI